MEIVLSRVDERLVHGQIITSWTKKLSVSKILIIDNQLAEDDFMKEILTLSAPAGLSFEILDIDTAHNILEESKSNEKVMLLFKNVESTLELLKKGYKLTSLNIGNIGSSPNKTRVSRNVSLSKSEIGIIEDLISRDVYVYLQMLYSDKKVDLKEFIEKEI